MSSFGFSYKKATQALHFFAQNNNSVIDKLKALKLIYLADRYHLRKFGSSITNDEYYAMKLGPVASGSKDILEISEFLGEDEREYVLKYLIPIPNTSLVKVINNTNNDELSETNIEALKYVWDKVGHMDSINLCNLTHQYPEWQKFEEQLNSGIVSRVKMELTDFFKEPKQNIDPFFELSEEEKIDKLEYLKELEKIDSLWN